MPVRVAQAFPIVLFEVRLGIYRRAADNLKQPLDVPAVRALAPLLDQVLACEGEPVPQRLPQAFQPVHDTRVHRAAEISVRVQQLVRNPLGYLLPDSRA